MSKLELLFTTLARALGVPEGSVAASFTRLRTAAPPMWTPVGRGKVRPDPTPTDAANLLLSFLVGGLATESPETVRLVRRSESILHDEHRVPRGVGARPCLAGLTDLPDPTLGPTLDAVLGQLAETDELVVDEDWWVSRVESWWSRTHPQQIAGAPDALKTRLLEANRRVTAGGITVHRSWMGWGTILALSLGQDVASEIKSDLASIMNHADLVFKAPDPAESELLKETDPQRVLDNLATAKRGYTRRSSSESIDFDALRALGACLRGDADKAEKLLSKPRHIVDQVNPDWPLISSPRVLHRYEYGEFVIILPSPDDTDGQASSSRRRR